MSQGGMISRVLHAIAMIAAFRRQRMGEGSPARMTLRERGVAPHFHFRFGAVLARHVIGERFLQIRIRH